MVEVKSLKGMPSGLLLASRPVHSGICTYKGINRHASNSYFVVGTVLGIAVAMETRSTRSQASGSSLRCGFYALPSVTQVESLNFWGSVVCRAHWETAYEWLELALYTNEELSLSWRAVGGLAPG